MIEQAKQASLHIVLGFSLVHAEKALHGDFLRAFLLQNLVMILSALLAINTTTSSVVMTKLREIADKNHVDFSATVAELHSSTREQLAYIGVSVLFSMLATSKVFIENCAYADTFIVGLLTAVFIAGLHVLYDTAESIFVILRFENKKL